MVGGEGLGRKHCDLVVGAEGLGVEQCGLMVGAEGLGGWRGVPSAAL